MKGLFMDYILCINIFFYRINHIFLIGFMIGVHKYLEKKHVYAGLMRGFECFIHANSDTLTYFV